MSIRRAGSARIMMSLKILLKSDSKIFKSSLIKGAFYSKTPADVWLHRENSPWIRRMKGRIDMVESLSVSSAGILTEYFTTIAFLQKKVIMRPRV